MALFRFKAFAVIVFLACAWASTSVNGKVLQGSPRTVTKKEFKVKDPEKLKKILNEVYEKIQVNAQEKERVAIKVTDDVTRILKRISQDDPCFTFELQGKGSSFEGLKICKPDEFDYGLVNDDWTGKIDLEVDKTTPPGFSYANQVSKTCLDKYKVQGGEHINPFMVRRRLRDLVAKAIKELDIKVSREPYQQGPAVTFVIASGEKDFCSVSIDLTIGIEQKDWPPKDIARPRPPGVKQDVKVQLVPKTPNGVPPFWQISFAQVETAIMENIDKDGGCRKKVLQLAKYFKIRTGEWNPLASYHLKTILLQMNNERKQSCDWTQEMLVPRFQEFFNKLLASLRVGVLNNFFVSEQNPQNLFKGMSKKELAGIFEEVKIFLNILNANPESLIPEHGC